ncbi:MAG: hypothetical protein HYT36_04065 [Candidatus Staskawiczbacteria bacterium]|nr:hypothetical protein [Candidatus Staskawiczbacteria bacterium]
MTIFQHKNLANSRWQKFSLIEQMANVGSEVERALNWREKDEKYSRMAFERALELLDLTLSDSKNKNRIMEITRVRELLCDYFLSGNNYLATEKNWRDYFYSFGYAAALQ